MLNEIQEMKKEYHLLTSSPEIEPLIEQMGFLQSKGISCYINNKKDLISFTSLPDDVFELYILNKDVDLALNLINSNKSFDKNKEFDVPEIYEKEKFKVKSLKYDIEFREEEIILKRDKYTFTSLFLITGFITSLTFYFAFTININLDNLIFYILSFPFIIGFLRELHLFLKTTIIRVNKKDKVIYKDKKIFLQFEEINSVLLIKNTSNENYDESYTLELELKNKSNFTIGESSDIKIYELGQRISKLIGIKLKIR